MNFLMFPDRFICDHLIEHYSMLFRSSIIHPFLMGLLCSFFLVVSHPIPPSNAIWSVIPGAVIFFLTDNASSSAITTNLRIFFSKFMSFIAVSSASEFSTCSNSSEDINFVRDGIKVIRPYTWPISAKMIDMKAFWNRASIKFINKTMSFFMVIYSVSTSINCTFPYPTRFTSIDFFNHFLEQFLSHLKVYTTIFNGRQCI